MNEKNAGSSEGEPGSIIVRTTRPDDWDGITSLCRRVYPANAPWTRPYLEMQHRAFPEGQLVAIDEQSGQVVGMAASLIIDWDDYDFDASYRDMTAGGTFANHDPGFGKTLYGAEVMVDPACQGRGVGKGLYAARRNIAVIYELERIRAGARIPGYQHYADQMSAEDYIARVVHGEIGDPTLTFQLRQGFNVLAVVKNYLREDRESRGYAAVIEWVNDAAATTCKLPKDPRFIAPEGLWPSFSMAQTAKAG